METQGFALTDFVARWLDENLPDGDWDDCRSLAELELKMSIGTMEFAQAFLDVMWEREMRKAA